MKSIFTKSLLFVVFTISAACAPQLVPFTTQVERETGLSKQQLSQVQFYNSSPIVLYRELSRNTTEVVSGQVKIVDGRQIEEIVIPPNTPGVLVSSTSNRLGISFESGQDRFLIFGQNKHRSGTYTLLAKNWKDNLGMVEYDGKEYNISTQSAATYLLINMQKLNNMNVRSRTARGRTIGGL